MSEIKTRAFTLMEVMVVMVIIAIISLLWVKITKSKLTFATKMGYYATVKDLQKGIGSLIGEGSIDSSGNVQKVLPIVAHTTDSKGFCDRLSDTYNTIGSVNYTATASGTDFSSATKNFALTNGYTFYNVGADLVKTSNGTCNPCPNPDNVVYLNADGICVDKADRFYANASGDYWAGASNECSNQGMVMPDSFQFATILSYYSIGKVQLNDTSGRYWLSGAVSNATTMETNCAHQIVLAGGYDFPEPTYMLNSGMAYKSCQIRQDANTALRCIRPMPPNMCPDGAGSSAIDGYYDIFVDVDGKRGKSLLNEDVFEFYLSRGGSIYPALSSVAANDTAYASAQIFYKANPTDAHNTILSSGLTYRQALCVSNNVETQLIDKLNYCSGYTVDTTHCPTTGNTCKVILTKPGY